MPNLIPANRQKSGFAGLSLIFGQPFRLFFVFALFLLFLKEGQTQCNPTNDSLELVALYNATNGPGWTNKTNWLVPGQPISNWYGIQVNGLGCVTCLDLDGNFNCNLNSGSSGNNLNGPFPSGITNLTNCELIDLSGNNLPGNIPTSIGDLQNLEYLDLSGIGLTSSIPTSIGNLPNLIRLYLTQNGLSGNIPASISNISTLEYCWLYSNNLTGTIPSSLGSLPNLQWLWLSNNDLSGSIPSELANPPLLWEISLSANSLTGSIPPEFGGIPNLQYLNLHDNQLLGSLPPELGNLSALTWLNASNNQLTGCFPGSYSNICSASVNFSGNAGLPGGGDFAAFCTNGTGACSSCTHPDKPALIELYEATGGDNWINKWDTTTCDVCNWYGVSCDGANNVDGISLLNNNLNGSLPDLNLPLLHSFNFGNNQISGSLPNFNMLPELRGLSLSNNQLSGNIPDFNLAYLLLLELNGNQFSGNIPDFNLPNLEQLYLQVNQLTGSIPDFNLPNLRMVHLDNNQLSGTIPNFDFPLLQQLELHNNQLSGTIPNFNFPSLIEFTAQNNQLTEDIPDFNMPDLFFLDLSGNQISGCFPAFICDVPGFNATNNSLLPWEGDHSNFCIGDPQIGAPCNNVNTPSSDFILSDCTCGEPCPTYTPSLAVNPAAICLGQQAMLTFNFSGGTAPWDVVYNDGSSNITLNNINSGHQITISPPVTTTYTLVSVADNNGCTADATGVAAIITVNPTPPVAASANQTTFCTGETLELDETGGSATYWNWTRNGIPVSTEQYPIISPAVAGSYRVTITDANGCTAVSPVISVIVNPRPTLTASNNSPKCVGQTVQLNASATGGGQPFQWAWSSPSGFGSIVQSPAVTNAQFSEDYSVTVSNSFGCTAEATTFVEVNPNPTTDPQPTSSPACPGDFVSLFSNAAANAGGNLSFLWKKNGTTVSTDENIDFDPIQPSNAGTYNLTVTESGSNCTAVGSTSVAVSPVPPVNATSNSPICPGATLLLDETAGGSGSFNWSWTGPNGFISSMKTPTISNVTTSHAGTYTVYKTGNSCTASATVVVTVGGGSTGATITLPPLVCSGQNITLQATAGATSYQWTGPNGWTSTIAAPILTNVDPVQNGNYFVTITVAGGCTGTASAVLTVNQTPTVAPQNDGPACADNPIQLNAGGANATNWAWSRPNGFSSNLQNPMVVADSSGVFTVVATAVGGCTASASTTVVVHPRPAILNPILQHIGCFGGIDGSISISMNSGTPPFSFAWSNGATTEDLQNLPAGSFNLTVTDSKNCTVMLPAALVLSQPTVLNFSATTDSTACFGQANGSIFGTTTGGTAPFSFAWSGGLPSVESPVDVAAGSYFLTITDGNSCTRTGGPFAVSQPAAIQPFASQSSPVSTAGASDGAAKLAASGGIFPISFNWQHETGLPKGIGSLAQMSDTASLQNLPAGNYFAMLTDQNGCTTTTSFTINDCGLTLSGNAQPVSCFGKMDGSIDLTASPANLSPVFLWNTGQTTADLANLGPGNYSVTATVGSGPTACTATFSASVSQPDLLQISLDNLTDVSCSGGTNGTISTLIEGGTGPFSFAWSNGATIQNLQNLSAGNYTPTVFDANGCSATASFFEIKQPLPLQFSAQTTPVSASGALDGTANLSFSGGAPPYQIDFSGVLFSPLVSAGSLPVGNLGEGSFPAALTDANGCSATISVKITACPLTISLIATDVKCAGDSNGAIELQNGSGGQPAFLWSNGATTASLSDLAAGLFWVTISHSSGCTVVRSAMVGEPSVLTISSPVLDSVKCFGEPSGSIQTSPSGGVGGYVFDWSAPAPDVQNPSGLVAGSYSLVVLDANGCSFSAGPFEILEPPKLNFSASQMAPPMLPGAAILTFSGGQPPFQSIDWAGGSLLNFSSPDTISGLPQDFYNFILTDSNGCTASASVDISDCAVAILEQKTDVKCHGESTGSLSPTVSGGVFPYKFEWSNGSTAAGLTGLAAGSYLLTVTDNGGTGCSRTASFEIKEPPAIQIFSVNTTDVKCPGGMDGQLEITFSGGTVPIDFSWKNGSLSGSASSSPIGSLTAGSYEITLKDANGCTLGTAGLLINEPLPLVFSAKSAGAGNLKFMFSGGTPPFSIKWQNGATMGSATSLPAGQTSFTNLPTGNYFATLTDANGCTTMLANMAVSDCLFAINAQTTPALCTDSADGQIDLTVVSPVGELKYAWSNGQTTADLIGLLAGSYFVTVVLTDGGDTLCTKTDTVDVIAPTPLGFLNFQEECQPGGLEFRVRFKPTGGQNGLFVGGQSIPLNAEFVSQPMPFGSSYSFEITDGNGCGPLKIEGQKDCCLSAADLALNFETPVCDGGNLELKADGPAGGIWLWTGPNGFVSNEKDPVLTGLTVAGSDFYKAEMTLAAGCSAIDSIKIEVQPLPVLSINLPSTACRLEDFSLSPNADLTLLEWNWTGPAGFSSTQPMPPPVTATTSGIFTLNATAANGCSATATAPQTVFEKQETTLEMTICTGDSVVVCGKIFKTTDSDTIVCQSAAGCDSLVFLKLNVQAGETARAENDTLIAPPELPELFFRVVENDQLPASGGWQLEVLQQPAIGLATVENDGVLRISIQNSGFVGWDLLRYTICPTACVNSCDTATVIFYIQPDSFSIIKNLLPNAITPNNDGKNDFFDPVGELEKQEFLIDRSRSWLAIVNRWGEIVFTADPYPTDWQGWNGENRAGHPLPMATYYYLLRLEWELKSKMVKGPIQVIRRE